MTEKTTPELPVTLAVDDWPTIPARNELALEMLGDKTVISISRFEGCNEHDEDNHDRAGGLCFNHGLNVPVDPAELMRNLAPFVPEVEPVDGDMGIDGTRSLWVFESRKNGWRKETSTGTYMASWAIEEETGAWCRLYAHPPVTSEPAPVPEAANAREVIEDILRNDPENPGVPRLFPISAQDVLKALDARGLTVVDAHNVVTAEPATAPLDAEALYVKHGWSGCAGTAWDEVAPAVREAWQCAARLLSEHATAPSVEQIAEVPSRHLLTQPGVAKPWHCEDAEGRFCRTYAHDDDFDAAMAKHHRHIAEDIHALYGTPGDAGEAPREGIMVPGSAYVEMTEARDRAEARVDELVAELEESDAMRINLANRVTEVENIARAEVERCKAALEAAEDMRRNMAYAKGMEDQSRSHALQLREATERAAKVTDAAKVARIKAEESQAVFFAARAAVEAETTNPWAPDGGNHPDAGGAS